MPCIGGDEMRKVPEAPKEIKKRANPDLVILERKYELITPLFGGGVEPGYADPITVIRGTEIRGHLRFWWRATRGGEFSGSLSAMKEAEDLLWGAASSEERPRPSQVQILVEVAALERGESLTGPNEPPAQSLSSPYAYVAFPLRDKPNAELLKDIRFTLRITFPRSAHDELGAALWAWETFGGIGARTRRGCGALRLVSVNNIPAERLPASANAIRLKIKEQLVEYVSAGVWPPQVAHLSRYSEPTITNVERSANRADGSSLRVWRILISALKSFRQSRTNGIYGRSLWPEPDAIRREAETHAKTGEKDYEPRPEMPTRFPRAAFGLPIEFKFKDEGDPSKTTLKGGLIPGKNKYRERLASRLILRPLACGDHEKDDAAVGLAIVLEAPQAPPEGLSLHIRGRLPKTAMADLEPADVGNIPPLNGEPDVLKAFLNTLQRRT
jgi:CRISPR-associated protein Cmr1